MAKIKIVCPHCEQQFSYNLPPARRMKRLSIRPSSGRFEYTATVDANILEAREFTRTDDAILYPVGAGLGALIGTLAHIGLSSLAGQAPPVMGLYMASLGASTGLVATHWWLCDEAKMSRRAATWFQDVSSRMLLIDEEKPHPVVLEVNHRQRDGRGELGRTINYFGTLPVEPEKFNDYIRAIDRGETLAIARWTGAGKPFSRQEYERLLEMLRQAGIAANLPGKGNQLTQAGRRAIKNHLKQAEVSKPPSPTSEVRA